MIIGFDVLLIYQHLGDQVSRETRGMIYFSREASNSHELTMPLLGASKGDGFGGIFKWDVYGSRNSFM